VVGVEADQRAVLAHHQQRLNLARTVAAHYMQLRRLGQQRR